MALTTYTELQASIADYLDRTNLTSQIPDFITLAEDNIISDLKAKGLQNRVTSSTSDEYISLPPDFVSLVNLQINSSGVKLLRFRSPEQLDTEYPQTTTGTPKVFTIVGNTLQLRPIPDQSYDYEMAYEFKIARLSSLVADNFVLINYPSLYLFGALSQAESFIIDDKRIPVWKSLYNDILNSINTREKKGAYSGSSLSMRSDTGNP